VGGQQFKEGDLVASVTAAASYDEAAYPDATTIDFRRNPRHMTFGWGPHLCVGNNLARQELRIAYEELTRRVPAFKIAEGCAPRRHSGIVLGIENLELGVLRGRTMVLATKRSSTAAQGSPASGWASSYASATCTTSSCWR